ncbi:hypothetical protein HBH53_098360 [Parastagonospora nodorum]|nr:hypothetical protein HBH53_098360 [Parastagonospora nodorum]KAH5805974.1 hypothetical protein HBI96_110210 [Parastagonospora nodorum]KAH5870488.1 hypothetical protein HBI90_097160 [Parastagonospora nodorum]KAH5952300.1 hypothetical protein HBI87_091330 [Parastagonospora nodorum]
MALHLMALRHATRENKRAHASSNFMTCYIYFPFTSLQMAVGRLQAALAAATNEVTVAAANLNFDFTLVKYEAPKEYQPLGGMLSTRRKDNAETGSSHKLARQLGALFEGLCPTAPKLLEAYGKRASEIAKTSAKASEPYIGTLFGDFTGIDGTSIWAAATSSDSALYVHLLASLLARMWSAQEATAIWTELVAERRKDIANKVDRGEPVKISLAAAAGQDITRSQLAAWDTSARAWLRTADGVSERKQKQLELILKNTSLPVIGDSTVFPGVISTWATAVETMEKLITGMPQAVRDGASLIGLSAWHLYPDMGVFSPEVKEIRMNDPLVAAGGFLSIGLATTPRTSDESSGVHWSLSLAQLRFYGRPVKVQRALENGARITFQQLNLVILGVLLSEWRMNESQGDLAAKAIISLTEYIKHGEQGSRMEKRLLNLLQDSAIAYSRRKSGDETLNNKLIHLGRRRAQRLVHGSSLPPQYVISPSFFGLLDSATFIKALRDSNSRIRFLRHVATSLYGKTTPADAFIIRYTGDLPKSRHSSHAHDTGCLSSLGEEKDDKNPIGHKTSIYKIDPRAPAHESLRTSTVVEVTMHDREFELLSDIEMQNSTYAFIAHSDQYSASESGTDTIGFGEYEEGCVYGKFSYATASPTNFSGLPDLLYPAHHRWTLGHIPSNDSLLDGELVTFDAHGKFKSWPDCLQITGAQDPVAYTYHVALGDETEAALFTRRKKSEQLPDRPIDLEDLLWCLEHDIIDSATLLRQLCSLHPSNNYRLLETLGIFAAVAMVYDDLPDMTIDVGVLERPIAETRCARDLHPKTRLPQDTRIITCTQNTAFAIIAYFESGIHDVDPKQLESVIALSAADSLFVSQQLLEDPYKSIPCSTGIRRILGNVGKPGVTFLLPPQEPMTRDVSTSSWKLNSYRPFDGSTSRSFESTSLHLSFTEYHVPLFDGSRGAHDNQISFLESVISVREREEIGLLTGSSLRRLEGQAICQHSKGSNANQDIIAVDSWDELLDKPDGVFVVRVGNNWIARLALTLVAYQRLQQTASKFAVTVCPADVCWTCTQQSFEHHAFIF